MPEIVAIIICIALLLVIICKAVARRDYRTEHPTIDDRERKLLERFQRSDMDADDYASEWAKLESERNRQ